MELREMRAFVTAIEEGSLSAAARRLSISQPALSQTIQGLERDLGVKLLQRSNTGIKATERGVTLFTEARAILARHDQAVARVSTSSPFGRGALRIGVPPEFPVGMLSDALAELVVSRHASGVEVRSIPTSEQITALQTGDLDVGLVRERPAGHDADVALVIEEKLGVLMSTVNATRLASPAVRLDQLAGLDWVGFSRRNSPAWYDEITAILRAHGVQSAPVYERSPTAAVKLAAISVGTAFALAPPRSCGVISSSVTWLPLEGHPLVRRTWAAWPVLSRRRDLTFFIECLRRLAPPAALPAQSVSRPDARFTSSDGVAGG